MQSVDNTLIVVYLLAFSHTREGQLQKCKGTSTCFPMFLAVLGVNYSLIIHW